MFARWKYSLVVLSVAAMGPAGLFAGTPEPDLVGYGKSVLPLFKTYCLDCHSGKKPDGKLSLTTINPDLLEGDNLETWRMIEEQLRFGDMPPKDVDQPTKAERAELLEWIRQELLKTQMPGFITEEKLLLPQFGNYVDHQALFGERGTHVTPAPPRIWRLRPEIYNAIVPRLGERITGLANGLNSHEAPEFKDYSATYFLDEASTQQLFGNAKLVAANLIGPNAKDRVFQQLASETPKPTESVLKTAIETGFRKALGRGPTLEEIERFGQLYQRSARISDNRTAAKALLTAILMQPEFLFRQELGDGKPDQFGRVRLSQREIAYALSYALADRPNNAFLSRAEKGQLATSKHVAEAVRWVLDEGLEENPRILQFFREYFHYPFATEVFKDQPEGGEHDAVDLVGDLELTIQAILERDEDVLKHLLTTRDYYVNAKFGQKDKQDELVPRDERSREYQTAYNLPRDWRWGQHLQPVRFREDERAGVLTHPAWLAAWSGNFENHPVQRGKWIRTHLLGGSVADVPIGVDAQVPEKEHTTFRDRLRLATQAAECWRCHKKMDPLGLPFERYDHYGRLQRLDAGQPVITKGEISRTPFSELHGQVTGPTDLLDRLADSEHVEQVFVRHVFRYFLGRNETLGDANTLQDAHNAYRSSGGRFRELVVSLLSSDSFLLRQLPSSDMRK